MSTKTVSYFIRHLFRKVLNSEHQQKAEAPMPRLLRPKGGDCLVKQEKTAHSLRILRGGPHMSILYTVVDTYLVDVEWVPVAKFSNDTESDVTLPATVTSQFVVVQNSPPVGLQEMVNGLRISSDGIPFKTFCAQETISPDAKEFKFTIEPGDYIAIYQNRWRFKHRVWFTTTSEVKGEERIVGQRPLTDNASEGNEGPDFPILERMIDSYVDSCEYTTIDSSSSGFSGEIKEVDITPAEEEFTKDMVRRQITSIPSAHQEAIIQFLV